MFGYVRPDMGELKVREAAVYRAFYCGVCRGLGRQCGPACRIFLQYDFALLALVMDVVLPEAAVIEQGRCSVNPLRKLPLAQGPAVAYAADAHGILLWAKARDDQQEGLLRGRVSAPLFGATAKKAVRRRPALMQAAQTLLREQADVEARAGATLDEAAQPFADFCAQMFAPEELDGAQAEALRWLGQNLGRWIYLADALNDREEDAKKGRFNPLLPAGQEEAAQRLLPVMNLCAQQACAALDMLPERRGVGIARNVLERGLFHTAQAVAQGGGQPPLRDEFPVE